MKYKKVLSIILIVVMSVFLFSGCKALHEETVRKKVTEFVEAFFISNDHDKAMEYCKSSARSFVDDESSFYCDKPNDVDVAYEIEDIEMDGDEATVTLYLRFEHDDIVISSELFELDMKNYDNNWKICNIEQIN